LIIYALLAVLAGLLIGSFLNVCIYRWPRDLSVVKPRSFCPACDKPIAWFDNIPLLSFFLLGGRCRNCHQPIPVRYPVVESLTALSFGFAVWLLGPTLAGVKFCVFAAILIALLFSDLEERILPDEFTLGGAVLGVLFTTFVPPNTAIMPLLLMSVHIQNRYFIAFAESLFGAVVCSVSLWIVAVLYQKIRHREGLGLGDVKMVAMIGAFLGVYNALLTLVVASVLGAVVGLLFIWFTGKDATTYELPFGTFLAFAALVVGFASEVVFKFWNGSSPF